MKKSLRAGAVIINPEGKIALVKEHLWGFPRGGKEEDEDFLIAAKREVEEETGLSEFTTIKELGRYDRYPHGIDENTPGAYPMEIHMFLFKVNHSNNLIPNDKNVTEAGWFVFDDALKQLTNEKDQEFLESKKELISKF